MKEVNKDLKIYMELRNCFQNWLVIICSKKKIWISEV